MIQEIYICLQSFFLGFGVISFFIFGCSSFLMQLGLSFYLTDWAITNAVIYCLIFYTVTNIILFIIYKGNDWQISVRSCFIGMSCGVGVIFSIICSLSYKPFGWYVIVLSVFHISEYVITAVTNPATLSLDSFLLNHSVAYWMAAVGSWLEFFLERWLFSPVKEMWYISILGVLLCIIGEVLRKLAMLTANKNFNHIVQVRKQENHELVTWGVYRFFRHPSYVGWFWWSVGTQVILLNPICLVAYGLASWKFFYDRINFEEMTLIHFFGQKYITYQKEVGTGLPLIKGYEIQIKS